MKMTHFSHVLKYTEHCSTCDDHLSLLIRSTDAQSNYISTLFNNCLDSKSFWHSIDNLLHQSKPSQIIFPSIRSADQFSSFFSDKIKTLPLNLPLINVNP